MKILLFILFPFFLYAHSLSVTASYENGELFIESYFGNGKACVDCEFTIIKADKELLKEKLDGEGTYENKIEFETPFLVRINGGMGHQAEIEILENEQQEQSNNIDSLKTTVNNLDELKIRQIIQSELKKQNKKIETIIARNKSKLEQMIVGLGYILGIFGLWQLFARKSQK